MANIFSILRIILTPVIIWLFFSSQQTASLAVFLIAALTDLIDGFIARKFKKETKIGKLLDPIADKILIIGIYSAFFIKQSIPLIALPIFGRELGVFAKSLFIFLRQKFKSSNFMQLFFFGKLTTFFQVITACVILLGLNPLYFVIITSIVSVIAGLEYLSGKQFIKI